VRKEFKRLLGLMGDRAASADALAILMLATSWITWRKATAEVARLGLVVMSGGTAIANPHLAVANTAHRQIVELCKELGLTPSARRKLDIEEFDDE
jgi:P27 family predicted phage terminase small subunit